MKKQKLWLIALAAIWIVWLTIMFILLTQPAAESSELSGTLTQLMLKLFPALRNVADLEYIIRKLAHFASFALSGALGLLTFRFAGFRLYRQIAIITHAFLAMISEILQTFADGRACRVIDMLIDLAGSICGMAFIIGVSAAIIRKRKGANP